MNIRIGRRLLFIGTAQNGYLPFAVHVDRESVERIACRIRPGDRMVVEFRPGALWLGERNAAVRLDNASVFCSMLSGSPADSGIRSANYRRFAALLRMYSGITGFGMSAAQVMDILRKENDRTELGQALIACGRYLGCCDPSLQWQAVRPLIGYGSGLTPAGDDFLIGAVGAGMYTGQVSALVLSRLAERLVHHPDLTTDISLEYLHYAVSGQFGSRILEVLNALSCQMPTDVARAVWSLIGTGRTSGIDTALGIYCMIVELEKEVSP
ncbi:DUF2877 domain-containing protein [Paenibacillus thiaminolyticus]|uniref:DUF2877 domain-containing protein n=1 Tax=Paenibacillus thiaminolyticus TaxID=49283 RepID=UPI0013F5A4BD|nr:DUF2877 domain-containing protein [Paenibacillus thiaminolyticus]NGP57250.1 DUF2877 domain-containing protein [Paenibacillus thiaminolyticus]